MKKIKVPDRIRKDVKDIFVYQEGAADGYTELPFFADGYPGIVYVDSEETIAKLPEEKKLTSLFMYGQTVHPITLKLKNPYLLLVFRIEQITGYQIWNSDSSELINNCLDLTPSFKSSLELNVEELRNKSLEQLIESIVIFISGVSRRNKTNNNPEIQKAIRRIIENDGNVSIKQISENLFLSERTFQRQFQKVVGVTPKQLALIIRYHHSKKKLPEDTSGTLFDTIGGSGFTDHSHFIKQFKRYSGKTPVEYLNYLKSIKHQPLD